MGEIGDVIVDELVDNPFTPRSMVPTYQPSLPADIERYVEAARLLELERRGMGAPATLRAYRADWASFCAWCASTGRRPLPALPLTVAQYIRYLIDRPKETVVDEYVVDGREIARKRTTGPAHPRTVARHRISIRKRICCAASRIPRVTRTLSGSGKGSAPSAG
jgi:hypothetical protein